MEWKHSTSPRTKKVKTVPSASKVMLTLFFNNEAKRNNHKCKAYGETLKRVQTAIKNRRPRKLLKKIVFLQDNATPHTAKSTKEFLEKFGWEVWDHPPYYPDLSPCDLHVFRPMKNALALEWYHNDAEVESATTRQRHRWKMLDRNFSNRVLKISCPVTTNVLIL